MLNALHLLFSPSGRIDREAFTTAFFYCLAVLAALAVASTYLPLTGGPVEIIYAVLAASLVGWPYSIAAMKRLRNLGVSVLLIVPALIFPIAALISGLLDIVAAISLVYFFGLTVILCIVPGRDRKVAA